MKVLSFVFIKVWFVLHPMFQRYFGLKALFCFKDILASKPSFFNSDNDDGTTFQESVNQTAKFSFSVIRALELVIKS